ncbi:MAG: BON domain-containing protein [Opitutaceae bacterium]|nr:BON domain-containing protein [Opitutaceae bacterium]
MKTILVFLLGAVIGAFAFNLYREKEAREAAASSPAAAPAVTPTPPPAPTPPPEEKESRSLREQARAMTRDASNAISEKLKEWKLTPDDIREDLKRGKEIVRTRAKQAGAELSDARIVTVLKAKYVLDRDLSALDINVDVYRGQVTLDGTVANVSLIGHAIALALDTDGVTHVISRLKVNSP